MRAFLGELRGLVLGETWIVPGSVAVILGACFAVRQLAPSAWESAGGLLILAGVVVALLVSTRTR